MAWVIERGGAHLTPRGWRPASGGEGTKFPTQGEAQEAMDELLRSSLAALGGAVTVKEVGE
jgi:hypothetical protein